MPKYAPRFQSYDFQVPKLSVDSEQWARLEDACQLKLSMPVRKEILACTTLWAFVAGAEGGPPLKELLAQLQRLEKLVVATYQLLPMRQQDKTFQTRQLTAKQIVQEYFQVETWHVSSPFDSVLPLLEHSLAATLSAVAFAKKQLVDPHTGGPDKGQNWGMWVVDLTKIAATNGLSTQVRKDWDKQAERKPSQFVRLIAELQKFVPSHFRQSFGPATQIALSQAIYRARQRHPSDPEMPPAYLTIFEAFKMAAAPKKRRKKS